MTAGEEKLVSYLEVIIRRTQAAEIEWRQSSASTLSWVKTEGDSSYVTSLQRSGSPPNPLFKAAGMEPIGYSYLFQVSRRPSKDARFATIISLNSQEKPNLTPSLEKLYQLAESAVDLQAASVLKHLLKQNP